MIRFKEEDTMTSKILKIFLTLSFFVCFHYILDRVLGSILPVSPLVNILLLTLYGIGLLGSFILSNYLLEKVKNEK